MGRKQSDGIHNRIRELRARHRMTQADLAKAIDVSRQTIVAIEKGEYNPSILLVLRMAAIFDEPADTIFWLADKNQ